MVTLWLRSSKLFIMFDNCIKTFETGALKMNLCEHKFEDWKTHIVDKNSPIGFVHSWIGNYLQKGYLLAPLVKPSKNCNFCVRSRVVRKKIRYDRDKRLAISKDA